ncbi:tripartite tricarboxylate transporter substrate binding protein [Pelosinus baikalensis]|uniref:Tripartite tricarboxylate transporter substrate binding protein n=1 Tax=Pelosinus baikalensis TaxID=2892015 RepID=A0ABS8HXM1_9FIRM|nr:tripartite tricarboxylate transporter substrate binding protein [Pelosinus baikalensis]MCC5467336.1 tripartite tricarboxylate transporter substrate binding protein [Pelosinus baikalensis]
MEKTIMAPNNFAEKPITVIVPFSVGGGFDLLARAMEKEAPKYFGQSLVIINKPGGAGAIGWNELVCSNPDGYTLGITGTDLLLLPLYGQTKYQYLTALDPIAQISYSPFVMLVQSDEWQNIDELIEYAKEHPGQIKFGHGGLGSMAHVVGEAFAKSAGINIEQVAFNGTSEATVALLGRHVQIAIMPPISVREQIKSGTVRALAVSSEKRLTDPVLAHIPTFKEQGLDVVFNTRHGIAAPKELPPEVKTKLTEGFKALISDSEFKSSMDSLGVEIEYLGSKESQNKWLEDNVKLTKIVQETGILDRVKDQKK